MYIYIYDFICDYNYCYYCIDDDDDDDDDDDGGGM